MELQHNKFRQFMNKSDYVGVYEVFFLSQVSTQVWWWLVWWV